MSASSRWFALTPRDTVFVRDGRAFDAGTFNIGTTARPWPSTVAGALGAAFGGKREQEPEAVRGPVLARRLPAEMGWELTFPAPLDLVLDENGRSDWVFRLAPRALEGVVTDLGAVEQLLLPPEMVQAPVPLGGWLPGDALGSYLCGEPAIDGSGVDVTELGPPYQDPLVSERRVGLARVGRVARDGFLYRAEHLRPREGWSLLAECVPKPDGLPEPLGVAQLGGQGRLADVEAVDGVSWPKGPTAFPGGRVLLYVATPALWHVPVTPGEVPVWGWLPPLPQGARLVAAAVGEAQPVASVSPRLGVSASAALRWAVPAGSVYLLRFGGDDPAEAAKRWATAVHGTALGAAGETDEIRQRLRTAGFGVVLTGVWG